MSGCHFSDGRCVGVEKYDPSFNPNTLEAQLAIKVGSFIVYRILTVFYINLLNSGTRLTALLHIKCLQQIL